MYSIVIRDHVMIAHSIPGQVFGPAQNLHGATYVVDVTFMRPELDENDIVVDIGLAAEIVKKTLADLNYRNLDDHPDFRGRRSTTEAVARWIFDRLAAALLRKELGQGSAGIERLRVSLHESHIASASYEAELRRA